MFCLAYPLFFPIMCYVCSTMCSFESMFNSFTSDFSSMDHFSEKHIISDIFGTHADGFFHWIVYLILFAAYWWRQGDRGLEIISGIHIVNGQYSRFWSMEFALDIRMIIFDHFQIFLDINDSVLWTQIPIGIDNKTIEIKIQWLLFLEDFRSFNGWINRKIPHPIFLLCWISNQI